MPTKEEILDNEYNLQEIKNGILSTFPVPFPSQLKKVATVAMDEYAKQQAIEFMKFVDAFYSQQVSSTEYDKMYSQFIEQQTKE